MREKVLSFGLRTHVCTLPRKNLDTVSCAHGLKELGRQVFQSAHRGSVSRKGLSPSLQKCQQYTRSMKMSIKPRTVPGKDIELRTLSLYETFRRIARTPYQVHTNSKPKDIGGVIKTHIGDQYENEAYRVEAIYSLKKSGLLGSYPVVHPAFKASCSINGTRDLPQNGI